MSDAFHKSCYTSRSSGYKYRTLSTNTGERKKRDIHDDNTFDKKFKELKRVINLKIDKEVSQTQKARESIKEKCDKIDAKITSMVELQNTVIILRKDLQTVENTLVGILGKVNRLEDFVAGSEAVSLKSRKSFLRSCSNIIEENNLCSATTHIE